MYPIFLSLVLAVIYLGTARAELFVVQPLEGSTCHANEPCTITWVDNGVRPLLSAVGVSTLGLYTGKQQLVQTIPPVDVSTQHSVTFLPNPSAGSDSGTYYIAITSTKLKGNNSIPYSGWSSFFTLTGMTGSFNSPLASATSSIPIPSTLPTSDGVGTSTRTLGAISTKTTVQTTQTTISTRFVTSSQPISTTQRRISTFTRVLPSSSPGGSASNSQSSTTAASVFQITPEASPLLPTTTPVPATSTSTTSSSSDTAVAAVTTSTTSSAVIGRVSGRTVLVLTFAMSIISSAFA